MDPNNPNNVSPDENDHLIPLLTLYIDFMTSLYQERYVDEFFTQLFRLQNDKDPNFVKEVTDLFLQDSERICNDLESALGQNPVDFAHRVDALIHQLKGCSASTGAAKITRLCAHFRHCCYSRDREGCVRCLQQMRVERSELQTRIDYLFMLDREIVAAGGITPYFSRDW